MTKDPDIYLMSSKFYTYMYINANIESESTVNLNKRSSSQISALLFTGTKIL